MTTEHPSAEGAQPDALRLADDLDENADLDAAEGGDPDVCALEWKAAKELRRLHARVQELERELVVEEGRAAQLRLTVSNLDHQHAMQAAMNSEARHELAAIRARGAKGESK